MLVTAEITVSDQRTLTINPGTYVEFQGHYKFNVQGQLLAVGTEQDSIVFTVADTTGFSNPEVADGGWHGLRFIETPAGNDSSLVKYCRIEYGKALGEGFDKTGGGICVYNFDKLHISHCLIQHNMVYGEAAVGGGIEIWYHSDPVIDNNTIANNCSVSPGDNLVEGSLSGGIDIYDSCNPIIRNNIITLNRAIGPISRAGGIYIGTNCDPLIEGNYITKNTAEIQSGGIRIHMESNPILINNVISENTVLSYSDIMGGPGGAGVWMAWNCNPVLINNLIAGNNAAQSAGGGLSINNSSNPTFINNTIVDNNAANGGGIFFAEDSDPNLTNNIIWDN
ncbi:MAG: right-handed parallel beta-helix repeat-containing protein, partial [Planctomycetes bacterium]|nr:right-handed parallel beta-helix repeat-containing protein [Planctomycetota bacterium]